MLKFKQIVWKKFDRKTGDYTKIVEPFAAYQIGRISEKPTGRTIEVIGPKQTFVLVECRNKLKKLYPPAVEGGNATVEELPLFFVTTNVKCAKIQGACHFALRGETLIPYKSSGRGLVTEL